MRDTLHTRMKKLHEDEQDWNKIITAYVGVLDHIRDVLKQIPTDFNEDDTRTFRESIADNDKQWAVWSVNNLIDQIDRRIGVFAQLESPTARTGQLRYIMIGNQGLNGRFTGWILDYAGGGCYEDHWFVNGKRVSGWDTDEIIENFTLQGGSRYLRKIFNSRESLVEWWCDTPHLKRAVINTISPITVGNTNFGIK